MASFIQFTFISHFRYLTFTPYIWNIWLSIRHILYFHFAYFKIFDLHFCLFHILERHNSSFPIHTFQNISFSILFIFHIFELHFQPDQLVLRFYTPVGSWYNLVHTPIGEATEYPTLWKSWYSELGNFPIILVLIYFEIGDIFCKLWDPLYIIVRNWVYMYGDFV